MEDRRDLDFLAGGCRRADFLPFRDKSSTFALKKQTKHTILWQK